MAITRPIAKILSIALAISYCYLGYVDVLGPFSLGVISVFFLFLIFISLQIQNPRMPIPSIFLILTLICMVCIWLDLVINNEFRLNAVQQFLTPIALFFCSLGIIYYLNFTKFYLLFFVSLILFSSLIALLQGLDINLAWDLRYAFPASTDIAVENQLRLKEKPSGLSFYAVQLGYQLASAGCLLLIINGLYKTNRIQKFVKYSFIFLLAAAAIGKNLSSMLSLIVMLFIFFNTQGSLKIRSNHLIIGLLLIIGLTFSPIWERIVDIDASMLSRITFFIVGIILLANNPFGVPITDTYEAKLEVVNGLFGAGTFSLLEYILETSFHNSFLNVGVQLGWLGFSLYIFLYLKMMHTYYSFYKKNSKKISIMGSVGFAFLFGYGIQCITHNSGPLTMDPYFWIVNGLLLGIISELKRKEQYA